MDEMIDPSTPVLIGFGQKTWRRGDGIGPRAMMLEAASLALADAGLGPGEASDLDLVGVVGFIVDEPGVAQRMPIPRLANPPATLAADLGAKRARPLYTHMGGHTPQALVNWTCAEIAGGQVKAGLLCGAEFLGSLMKRLTTGLDLSAYGGGMDTSPERWGDGRPDYDEVERAYELHRPVNIYPMFENALRAQRGLSFEAHRAQMGRLFVPFTTVAGANPHAWFPIERSAADLTSEGPNNRMVGFPYPKYLNAIMQVDQAAAVIVTSSAQADAWGVPELKRVYLHGCAEATELFHTYARVNYHSSPAMRTVAREAFDMAGRAVSDMALFDIYSCFPSAVSIACAELGLAEDDPRGLTVTGGLPYFGGPGNNYVMHSIAEMAQRLRKQPGAFGLVTANGGYLTKQAMGIYSTKPVKGEWARRDPKTYQVEIDALAVKAPEFVREPQGKAVIETYTVAHLRSGERIGIVFGRDGQDRRFVANVRDEGAALDRLQREEGVGQSGVVTNGESGLKNLFALD
jgi:acetyl-CoA C-acetyltransferase